MHTRKDKTQVEISLTAKDAYRKIEQTTLKGTTVGLFASIEDNKHCPFCVSDRTSK